MFVFAELMVHVLSCLYILQGLVVHCLSFKCGGIILRFAKSRTVKMI